MPPAQASSPIRSAELRAPAAGRLPSDWIVDCGSQLGFRELLALYRRGIETPPLPDPFG